MPLAVVLPVSTDEVRAVLKFCHDNGVKVVPACSMQHGQQIREQPKHLLKAMGFVVKDVPEGHICCG